MGGPAGEGVHAHGGQPPLTLTSAGPPPSPAEQLNTQTLPQPHGCSCPTSARSAPDPFCLPRAQSPLHPPLPSILSPPFSLFFCSLGRIDAFIYDKEEHTSLVPQAEGITWAPSPILLLPSLLTDGWGPIQRSRIAPASPTAPPASRSLPGYAAL